MSKSLLVFFSLILMCTLQAQPVLNNLLLEGRESPLGIDVQQPRFSWELSSAQPQLLQTHYQIIVSSSLTTLNRGEGDVWDSGKVPSDRSILNSYKGKSLQSKAVYFWKVRVWSNQGVSAWSAPQHWSMGLLNKDDWKASWMGLEKTFPWDSISMFARLSARYFRKDFAISRPIKRATVYVSGLGLYELHLNGEKVGDQVLAPVPTDYDQTVLYNTFDVTDQLLKGNNAIGLILGNGRFFTMRQNYKPHKWHNYGLPRALLQLEIEYSDGSTTRVVSDASWKVTADGPIRTNNEYDGEEFDATKSMVGWDKPGYTEKNWYLSELVTAPKGQVKAQLTPPMKVLATIDPKSVKAISGGRYIVDMGQNFAGWLKIRVTGKKGDTIKLRFAESLTSSGELFVANLRDAKVTDKYVLSGNGVEAWNPTFIYHGFRYVELTGWPGELHPDMLTGEVVSDEMEITGNFQSSNSVLNALHKNAYWGILSNYKGMPVDCPQRNERQPWLGDRTSGAYGEGFLFQNNLLYAKWLDDIRDAQKPEGSIPDVAPSFWFYYKDNMTWSGAFLNIANTMYQQFGDTKPIEKHYDAMKKWLWYMKGKYKTADHIMNKDSYGDWCMVPETLQQIQTRDSTRITDPQLIATAYYHYFLKMMAEFALLTERVGDTAAYQQEAKRVHTAFNKKFFQEQTSSYSNGTATSYLLPLAFGLVPDGKEKAVFQALTKRIETTDKGHISTGVIGTAWIMRTLHRLGRQDLALKLATNTTYPSWGYMVKEGATAIWELWNGNTAPPAMNSQNHVMLLGDLLVWMYEDLAGIRSQSPGFKRLLLKPSIDLPITDLLVSYKTPHGLVQSQWVKDGEVFTWACTIPGNTTAEIRLSKARWSWNHVLSTGLRVVSESDTELVLEAGSGRHSFTFRSRS